MRIDTLSCFFIALSAPNEKAHSGCSLKNWLAVGINTTDFRETFKVIILQLLPGLTNDVIVLLRSWQSSVGSTKLLREQLMSIVIFLSPEGND